ncbi:Wzz/FepE/Etk N-terminal domain-containing protein [Shewanella sp. YLB-07]|uniref:Wzz/FepE/Etk N-terminal domain-containing protein n=1 Tax=Shewanella sp. YLB-07 TaxID=2601268 RepID=UPI00128E5B4A|nr:Wzz/FepE/Etk N-terminal domain-containing protein [Shewanella sp. YLB-07]MPY24867.1 LPS O-antigen length regulator [Shewanella sp. YLB-07]
MSNEINRYKQEQQLNPAQLIDEIDLRELISVIWQGKWLIIAITAVFVIGSVIFAINQPNIYRSEALLAPVSKEQRGGLSGLASQFGGLVSMGGINFGNSGVDDSQMAIEVMKSRLFASQFIQKHNILPDLMASKTWVAESNSLIYNEELYSVQTNTWVSGVKAQSKAGPSMQEAFKKFNKIFTVNSEKGSGMVTVSVEHLSPFVAQQWVNWLVEDVNMAMKERDVSEAMRSSDFLNKQISETTVADIRSILYKLIEEQAKTIMFAEVRDEYVFTTIDPALVPEERIKPNRTLICILGFMLGGVLGLTLVLGRFLYRSERLKLASLA